MIGLYTARKLGVVYTGCYVQDEPHARAILRRAWARCGRTPTDAEYAEFLNGGRVSVWGREYRMDGVSAERRQMELF